MSRTINYKPCQYDRQKNIGYIYVPSVNQFMCKSIRQYYVKVQLLHKGYPKEKVEKIIKTMVI